MRILIISHECDSIDLARRLVQEGNKVKFYCNSSGYDRVGMGFGIRKVRDWKRELSWVGKDGLIIFDYTGFGKTQDELRAQGYAVVGGSETGDRLELDRNYASTVLKEHGLNILPQHHFGLSEAIKYIKEHAGPWVIKHNGYADKTLTYVGRLPDGRDVIDVLNSYRTTCRSVVIQKKVQGVEIGVGRFFNGEGWTGPIELNIEHKKLFTGGLGPKTSEMGTLMWFVDNEQNRLFSATIGRLTPWLQQSRFKGDIDINCIINEEGIFPLEVTARFGYPALHGSCALTRSPFGEFLKAVADGKESSMQYHESFGIVVQMAVPPFPYRAINETYNPEGLKIYFTDSLTPEDMNHIHFNDVCLRKKKDGNREYTIAARHGYVMCITGIGDTVDAARHKAYSLIGKAVVPKMFYRKDIGVKFVEQDQAQLQQWGWL